MKQIAAIFLSIVASVAGPAGACSFHTYLPERTVIDRLLETENVVLARPAPDDPFRFEAVEALEGTMEQADLPTLVDSTTRRRLAVNPDDAVLFARDGGGYGPFERLIYVDSDWREVLDLIMANKPDWISGDDLARYQFFANLLSHPAPELQMLALREIDRANYDIFRALDVAPDAATILARMNRPQEMAYRPIRVLLLGRSDDPLAQDEILAGLERSLRITNSQTLGPYATAFVEQRGPAGVDWLAEEVLADPAITGTALELVVETLAIHAGAGDEPLRAHILDRLASFVEARPDMADMVARQFLIRYDFGMGNALEALMKSGRIRSARVLIPVSSYVANAQTGLLSASDLE